jgi:hypothetical protein
MDADNANKTVSARIQALEHASSAAAGDQSFEFGLQVILDGLQARLAARPVPANPGRAGRPMSLWSGGRPNVEARRPLATRMER